MIFGHTEGTVAVHMRSVPFQLPRCKTQRHSGSLPVLLSSDLDNNAV
jgi:hypothetical protein